MSDDTAKPDLGPNASKADLKSAADDLLKQAKAADKAAAKDAADDVDVLDEEFGDAVPELEPQQNFSPDQQIQILEAEKEEMRDQLLRTLAEMENIRKRSEREKIDARVYAIEKFARDMLNVADNMARALEALPDAEREVLTEGGKGLLGGIEMTQKELHTVLTRHGVTMIDAEPGSAFDPNLHQAVANIPSEHPNGSIASHFQAGWRIGDRVLRAAMVAVSAGAAN